MTRGSGWRSWRLGRGRPCSRGLSFLGRRCLRLQVRRLYFFGTSPPTSLDAVRGSSCKVTIMESLTSSLHRSEPWWALPRVLPPGSSS